jgi:hypothetical protein
VRKLSLASEDSASNKGSEEITIGSNSELTEDSSQTKINFPSIELHIDFIA